MAADPDHPFVIPDNDFFGLGPAEYAGEAYQQGLLKAEGIHGLFPRPAPAPGQAPTVGFRKASTRKPAPRMPCTFKRAPCRCDGSEWPAHISEIQPWLICFVCGQQFSPASICIHERQCLAKYTARARRIDPTPRRPRIVVEPPLSVQQYNELSYMAYNESANSRCPLCGKTFANDRIEKHVGSCNDVADDEEMAAFMSHAIDDGQSEKEAVGEAMRLWRQTHPKPSSRLVPTRPEGGNGVAPDGMNELLFREWLDEMRGYNQCHHERREGESVAAAAERHLEYVEYVSTVGEHLQGKPVQKAIDDRNGGQQPAGVGGRRSKIEKRLRQISQLRAAEEAGVRVLSEKEQALVDREGSLRTGAKVNI